MRSCTLVLARTVLKLMFEGNVKLAKALNTAATSVYGHPLEPVWQIATVGADTYAWWASKYIRHKDYLRAYICLKISLNIDESFEPALILKGILVDEATQLLCEVSHILNGALNGKVTTKDLLQSERLLTEAVTIWPPFKKLFVPLLVKATAWEALPPFFYG